MSGDQQSVLISDEGAVRTLTLNRPGVLNSFNTELLQTLGKAVRAAEKDKSVRCLVLTGAGRAFSAGQDLAEVEDAYTGDGALELGRQLRRYYNPVVIALRTMEKPVIASVNGVAAGAGCGMALACDLRVAASSSSFIQAFVHVGVVPDCGSTFMLPRLIGLSRAMELASTGRKVSAEEALRIGLVNQVADDDQVEVETKKLANRLAGLPTRAIGLTKRALNASWSADLETQLDYEAMLQATASETHDHREGVLAFLEKRPPRFTGQ